MERQLRSAENIFVRMHPLARIMVSLLGAAVAYFVTRGQDWNWRLTTTLVWDSFGVCFLLTSWIVLCTRPVDSIIRWANRDDGSKWFVMISLLVASCFSLLMALLLVISNDKGQDRAIIITLAVIGMLASWAIVHTIFAFHYAHMYYQKAKDDTPGGTALAFPDETKPDYLDFAYFSFVIGMTFQVSDVEISSRKLRRLVLMHGLLSFILNTFVLALTINLIAGLKK